MSETKVMGEKAPNVPFSHFSEGQGSRPRHWGYVIDVQKHSPVSKE